MSKSALDTRITATPLPKPAAQFSSALAILAVLTFLAGAGGMGVSFLSFVAGLVLMPFVMFACLVWALAQTRSIAGHLSALLGWQSGFP